MAARRNYEAGPDDDAGADIAELQRLRQQCLGAISSAVASCPNVLSHADVAAYEKDVISDQAFALSGVTDTAEKIRMVQENIDRHIPDLVSDARELEQKFSAKIGEAVRSKWISDKSATAWLRRLKSENHYYWKKKEFIENPDKFSKFIANWKETAEAAKKLRENAAIKHLTSADVAQIGVFMNVDQFLSLPFGARDSLTKTVSAALLAKEKHMPELFAKAKGMLEAAASNKALSRSKVGTWLERIFKSGAKAELIEKFLNNQGTMPLQKLINNWAKVTKEYQNVEEKRKKEGTPPGFHFVSMDVFLNWRFEQRTSYVNEAEKRFRDIDKEEYLFLQIGHELGAKDWEGADELIAKARKKKWSVEDEKKLQSMEKFLREHRSVKQTKNTEQNPRAILERMHQIVEHQIPVPLQKLYRHSLSHGYQAFWTLTTLMYNRVWCHQHNMYDDRKEQIMEKQSKDPTRKRIKEGHAKRGTEVNNIRDDTAQKEGIRNQGGVRGAQIMFTNEHSQEALMTEIDRQKDDRNFWYWTSIIPQGVQYPDHLNIVMALHPEMKKLARQLESFGIHYPRSGKIEEVVLPDHVVSAKK